MAKAGLVRKREGGAEGQDRIGWLAGLLFLTLLNR